MESTIVGIVKSLIDNYSYDLTDTQKKKLLHSNGHVLRLVFIKQQTPE